MSFQITLPAGGQIDKVRELPYPHFSKMTIPFVVGRTLDVQGRAECFNDPFKIPFPSEFLSVAFAASKYCVGDYWELTLGGEKICHTMYTKELPESVSMGNSFGIVYPLPADTEVTFDFYNVSGEPKQVWYNIKLLRDQGGMSIAE